jgi:hypothetical protein
VPEGIIMQQLLSAARNHCLGGKKGIWLSRCMGLHRYILSQHPEVEQRLVAELDAAGLLVTPHRPHPRPLQMSDLAALTYLSWVCKVVI